MHRRKGRGRVFLLVFLALSILIITLDFRGGSGPLEAVRDFTAAIVAPIQRGITTVTRPVGNFFSAIGDLANLREENRDLKAENEQLRAEIEEARNLTEENEELLRNLDLEAPWFAQDKVAAEVIADAPNNYRWAIVINKGTDDGIREDMAVISPDGLVGKIIGPMQPDTATVLLMIDPNFGAVATTEEEGIPPRPVTGNGEGQPLSMQRVDKGTPIEFGNRVVTSNLNGGIFPRNIPIGYVSDVGGDERASQMDIDIEPYVDFNDLNVVQILLGTGDTLRLGEAEDAGSSK
jgi:rod shape-determining protein MreC